VGEPKATESINQTGIPNSTDKSLKTVAFLLYRSLEKVLQKGEVLLCLMALKL
jgi:hypothetical protein